MTPERRALIEESIAHWNSLADLEDRMALHEASVFGPAHYTGVFGSRAKIYRDTAKALQLELDTGVEHCTCCLAPRKTHGAAHAQEILNRIKR